MKKIGNKRVVRKVKEKGVEFKPSSFRLSDFQKARIYKRFETIQAFFTHCYKNEFARKRKNL